MKPHAYQSPVGHMIHPDDVGPGCMYSEVDEETGRRIYCYGSVGRDREGNQHTKALPKPTFNPALLDTEVAEREKRPMGPGQCELAPRGWHCNLDAGHDGPCPAWARWWNWRAPRGLRSTRRARRRAGRTA